MQLLSRRRHNRVIHEQVPATATDGAGFVECVWCADSVASSVGLLGSGAVVPEAGPRRSTTGWEAASSAGAAPTSHPLEPAFTCAPPRPLCHSPARANLLFKNRDAPVQYAHRGLTPCWEGARMVLEVPLGGHACSGVDGASG